MNFRRRSDILWKRFLCFLPEHKEYIWSVSKTFQPSSLCILRFFFKHSNCCFIYVLVFPEKLSLLFFIAFAHRRYLLRVTLTSLSCLITRGLFKPGPPLNHTEGINWKNKWCAGNLNFLDLIFPWNFFRQSRFSAVALLSKCHSWKWRQFINS